MLGDDHRGSQFDIDFPDSIQEIRGCNGIQLTGRLVQDQHLRLHGHDGCQVQQLLLTAGKVTYIPMEPILDTKVAGHFRNSGTHGLLVTAQGFQAKCQLMPDLIGNDLVIRILHHIADLAGLVPLGNLFHRNAVEQDLTGVLTMRRQNGFQMPQQGGLAGTGLTAEDNIFALLNRQIHVMKRVFSFCRCVRKAQIFDLEMCHWIASLICNTVGMDRYAQ